MKKLVILLIGFLFTGLLAACDNIALQHDNSDELIDSMTIVVDNAITETVHPTFEDMQAFSQYVEEVSVEHHFENLLTTLPSSIIKTIGQKCLDEYNYVDMDAFLSMYYQIYNKELPPDIHIPELAIDTTHPNMKDVPIVPLEKYSSIK